jgi:dUTPase
LLIPSGICFNLPKGYCLVAFNKSSIASKKGISIVKVDGLIETIENIDLKEIEEILTE